MKLIKFDLPIDGVKVKNIEELREHFTVEVLAYFRNGMLAKWLRSRNLTQELLRVQEIDLADDKLTLTILCSIFEIDVDENIIDMVIDPSNSAVLSKASAEEFLKLNTLIDGLNDGKKSDAILISDLKSRNKRLELENKALKDGLILIYKEIEKRISDVFEIKCIEEIQNDEILKIQNCFKIDDSYLTKKKLITRRINFCADMTWPTYYLSKSFDTEIINNLLVADKFKKLHDLLSISFEEAKKIRSNIKPKSDSAMDELIAKYW